MFLIGLRSNSDEMKNTTSAPQLQLIAGNIYSRILVRYCLWLRESQVDIVFKAVDYKAHLSLLSSQSHQLLFMVRMMRETWYLVSGNCFTLMAF